MSVPLITIHVIVSIIIILIVLLQVGRGAEAGAMFGGSGQAQMMRGSSTFIGKFTTGLAVTFMLTSLLLTYYTSDKAKSSVIDNISKEKTEESIPETQVPAAEIPGKNTESEIPESDIPLNGLSPEKTDLDILGSSPVAPEANVEKKSTVLPVDNGGQPLAEPKAAEKNAKPSEKSPK